MVRVHDFSVELVEADTKQPFKEHPGRNRFNGYVEVEPGVEYLIKLRNYSNHLVISKFKVDCTDLGFHETLDPQDNVETGWKKRKLYMWTTSKHH